MATGMDSAGHMTGVVAWLLDSDPAIRWQVMRDLTREPADPRPPTVNGRAARCSRNSSPPPTA